MLTSEKEYSNNTRCENTDDDSGYDFINKMGCVLIGLKIAGKQPICDRIKMYLYINCNLICCISIAPINF